MKPKVELKSIHVRYFSADGETEALRALSLTVQPGEFVAIVGQSGCGKSTLLSLIAGIVRPTSGTTFIDGVPVKGPNPLCGYMLQRDHLFEWRTIIDNVLLGPEVQGLDRIQSRQQAETLLRSYGLEEFMTHYPRQLSGGMRQRAAIARTLCTKPDILLLDEPFSALDFQTRLTLADEIGGILRREHKTVILVTHDIAEAISLADRVFVMTNRPGTIKTVHDIRFPSAGETRPSAFNARKHAEFDRYFSSIWRDLEIRV